MLMRAWLRRKAVSVRGCLRCESQRTQPGTESSSSIVQAVGVWSKVIVPIFGCPRKVAYHGLEVLEPVTGRAE